MLRSSSPASFCQLLSKAARHRWRFIHSKEPIVGVDSSTRRGLRRFRGVPSGRAFPLDSGQTAAGFALGANFHGPVATANVSSGWLWRRNMLGCCCKAGAGDDVGELELRGGLEQPSRNILGFGSWSWHTSWVSDWRRRLPRVSWPLHTNWGEPQRRASCSGSGLSLAIVYGTALSHI